MPTTTHLIAAREDFRVRNLIEAYSMNIIKYTWLLTCRDYGTLVDFDPTFMLYTNKHLKDYFKLNIDNYGDHFTQPVDAKRLKNILDAIPDSKAEADFKLLTNGKELLEEVQHLLDDLDVDLK